MKFRGIAFACLALVIVSAIPVRAPDPVYATYEWEYPEQTAAGCTFSNVPFTDPDGSYTLLKYQAANCWAAHTVAMPIVWQERIFFRNPAPGVCLWWNMEHIATQPGPGGHSFSYDIGSASNPICHDSAYGDTIIYANSAGELPGEWLVRIYLQGTSTAYLDRVEYRYYP